VGSAVAGRLVPYATVLINAQPKAMCSVSATVNDTSLSI